MAIRWMEGGRNLEIQLTRLEEDPSVIRWREERLTAVDAYLARRREEDDDEEIVFVRVSKFI